MRIAIVSTYYPFPPSVGGVENIVRNVASELAKRGYSVHIITTPLDVTTQKAVSGYGVEEHEGIIIHKLRPSTVRIGYARLIYDLKKTIDKIRPDIVHSHNLHPHLFQLANWRKKLKYGLIAELHYPAVELDFFIQKLLMPLAMYATMKISERIDYFLVHTKKEKNWLIENSISEEKIVMVKLPAVPNIYFEHNCKNITHPNDVIYLGRIVPRKGIDILIKALYKVKKTIRNIKVTIAGPSDPKYKIELEKLIKKLKLENNIYLRGSVAEEEKILLLKKHKVFVLPSIKDYTPNVILEAQALGIPVIASKVGSIPEMMIDGETGFLVKPKNIDELASSIVKVLTDDNLRNKMSLKALQYAKNFSYKKTIDQLDKIYVALV